jgi:hypothetical protein
MNGFALFVFPLVFGLTDIDSESRFVIGFGGRFIKCRPERFACKSRLPFERIRVVRDGAGPLEVLGVTYNDRREKNVTLWQTTTFASWTEIKQYPANVVNAFAVGAEVSIVLCEANSCKILFTRNGEVSEFKLPTASALFWRATEFSWHQSWESVIFPGPNEKILRLSVQDGRTEILTSGTHSQLSADGKKLAVLVGDRIEVFDLSNDKLSNDKAKVVASGSMWKGSMNHVFFWSSDLKNLYVNYESGYFGGDGYRCVRIDVESGRAKRVWTAPMACEAEVWR